MKSDFKSSAQAASYQASSFACCLRVVQGFCGGTAGTIYYIHAFDVNGSTASAPANGAQPLKSLQIIGQDGFSFSFELTEVLATNGIFFALSSTEETYTAVIDGAKATWQGSVDQVEPGSMTVVGDLGTSVASLQVWSEAVGSAAPKKLVRLDIINNSGAVAYPFVSSADAFTSDDSNIVLRPIASAATGVYSFGRGSPVFKNISASIRQGCTIFMCATPTYSGSTAIVALSFKIRAMYVTA